jgi:hypothetical protein
MIKITPREDFLSEEEKARKLGQLEKEHLIEKLFSTSLVNFEEKTLKKIMADERNLDVENIDLLTLHKELKIEHLNKKCNEEILKGFVSNALNEDHFYGFDEEDQSNFTMQLAFINSVLDIQTVEWKTEDAGVLSHTKEQFIAVCMDGENHKRQNIFKYWTLKAEVENAMTQEEINLIEW